MGYRYEKIKDIKRNAEFTAGARAVLRGRWADAIGATGGIPFAMSIIGILAGIICYGVVTASLILNGAETGAMTIVIAMILTALVTGSLRWASYVYSVAAIRWDLGLISGEDTSIVRSCKTALKLYTKVFLANLAAALIVLGKYLLLIVPGILAAFDYALIIPCLLDDPDLSVRDALRRSRALMHGHRWQCFCLAMRFWGWGILCIFTLGIGFFWLWPYMMTSWMLFYRNCLPDAESEEYAKLPPAVRKSRIGKKLNIFILVTTLLLSLLWAFCDAYNTVQEIAEKIQKISE